MKFLRRLLLAAPAVALAAQKVLKGTESPLDDGFRQYAQETLETWHVPGLAIAVVDGGKTFSAGYGNATLPSVAVTPETLFYAGSTTKAFTAAAVSLLIDSGNFPSLTWESPISSLIRDDFVLLPEYEYWQDNLALVDALSHRTGFARHDGSFALKYGPDAHKATVRDYTRSLRSLPMASEPRTKWRYCNLMFLVVSHVVQTLSGKWIGTVFKDSIWGPLGMNSTYLSLSEAKASPNHLSSPYYWDYDSPKGGFKEAPQAVLSVNSGAGGIASNVVDYAKWMRCLLTEGQPLSKSAHAAIKKPRMVITEKSFGFDGVSTYALGWIVNTYRGHRFYMHGGGMEAYGTELYFFPDLGYGLVTMGNTATTSNIAGNQLIWRLIDDKLGVPAKERYDWEASGKNTIEEAKSRIDNAVEILYPNRTEKPLLPALPLHRYTGTFFHPAYQNLTIRIGEASFEWHVRRLPLQAVKEDAIWPAIMDFEHVSGEYWVIYIKSFRVPLRHFGQTARAEFRIGPSGVAEQLVVEFMEDGPEGITTFHRIE